MLAMLAMRQPRYRVGIPLDFSILLLSLRLLLSVVVLLTVAFNSAYIDSIVSTRFPKSQSGIFMLESFDKKPPTLGVFLHDFKGLALAIFKGVNEFLFLNGICEGVCGEYGLFSSS